MKIRDTINFIQSLINDTEKKSEIKFYKIFINTLLSLETKDLSKDKIALIENKIDELNLNSIQEKRVKYLKERFAKFTKFLESDFSLIQQGHYVSLGMALGMMFGLAVASITGFEFGMGSQTTGGLIGGMIVGMIVGSVMDSRAEKENRVLKNKK